MSSPNLNIVTLLGSGLTYTSAYLFGIQEQSLPSGNSMEKLIQVSVLMKICSAAKKLTHSLPAPVLCQAVVTVWRIPSSFVFLSACCTSTSPAACLQECPLGTCLKSLPWCRCGLQNSKGRSDRKCLVAFCVCVCIPPPSDPLTGEAVPAVRRDLPGVRPCPGEELAPLQGVHPAGARQAGGEYPGSEVGREGGRLSMEGKHQQVPNQCGTADKTGT